MKTTAPVAREPARRDSGDIIDSDETSQLIKMEADDESEVASPIRRPTTPSPEQSALKPTNSAARTRPDPSPARDAAVAQAWRAEATDPGRDLSAEIQMPAGPMLTDSLETRPVPKQDVDDSDEVVELTPKLADERPEHAKVSLADLAARAPRLGQVAGSTPPQNAGSTLEMEIDAGESDARMRRVTNPVEGKRPSAEAMQFASEAKQALEDAAKARESGDDKPADAPAARTKAATLPPIKPPTVPPPLGRRPPTIPPMAGNRPPSSPGSMTAPPPDMLRPPAPAQVPLPGMTAPPPLVMRPPGPNLLDDMITLRPQYEQTPGLVIKDGDDGSILVEPARPTPNPEDAARTQPRMIESEDAARTQPRMEAVSDDTSPNLELPLRAPISSPAIPVDDAATSWGRNLARRLDRQLEEDFGTETPASPPTRAELQALLNTPPDPTRQQSLEELEALHRAALDRRSEPELEFTRRAPYPTAEVDESDIEAAIEIAPPVRRANTIGVAKKKPTK
jgi:hypothetical protein